MTDEIRITREELAADLVIALRVGRQKQPGLFRALAAHKDDRGYPDRGAEDRALRAFAEWLAERIHLSGKRIVRDRPLSLQGTPERTSAELGIVPNGRGG